MRVAKKLQAWADTQDSTVAESVVGHIEVHDAHDRFKPIRVDLREISAEDLRHVFGNEAAARAGSGAIARNRDVEATDDLKYAAARIAYLLGEARPGTGDLRWPHNTAALVYALQRAAESSTALLAEATDTLGQELAEEHVAPSETTGAEATAVHSDVIEQFEDTRRSAAEQLADAARSLAKLGGLVDGLQRSFGLVTAVDGPTLVDEAVLEFKVLPFMSGIGRYHIRRFNPGEDAKPLVVIGDLSDNQSTSVMNSVEEIAAAAAETLLEDVDAHAVEWVQLVPAEMFPTSSTTDVVLGYEREKREKIELVQFGEPFGSPDFRPIDRAMLEELAGGPVRFWHASNYTSSELVSTGVRLISPETRSRIPQPKKPTPLKVTVEAEPARTVDAEAPRADVEAVPKRRRWSPFKSRS